jgi:hypothetical protein
VKCEVSVMGGAGSDQGVYGTAANLILIRAVINASLNVSLKIC